MTICGTFTMSGIPNGQQNAVVNGYENTVPKPLSVTPSQAADGTWTVVAVWPPCPVTTTVVHTANNSSGS